MSEKLKKYICFFIFLFFLHLSSGEHTLHIPDISLDTNHTFKLISDNKEILINISYFSEEKWIKIDTLILDYIDVNKSRKDASDSILSAYQKINEAKIMKWNTTAAEIKLESAKNAYGNGDYITAKKLADDVANLLVPPPPPPPPPSNATYIISKPIKVEAVSDELLGFTIIFSVIGIMTLLAFILANIILKGYIKKKREERE